MPEKVKGFRGVKKKLPNSLKFSSIDNKANAYLFIYAEFARKLFNNSI